MSISAVMPLCVRGSYDVDDLSRSEILLKTLTVFAEQELFSRFIVVVPDDEVSMVKARYGNKWDHLNLNVISETELVPELNAFEHVRGWRKQQIIKLAAPRIVDTKFYITFDADVICLKPLSYEQLIIDGKAIMQYEQRSLHPKWWRSSARILRMSPEVGDTNIGMSVTPAILSTALSLSVTNYLESIEKRNWVYALCSLHNPRDPKNWRLSRFLKIKWTEYSLYYLNAMRERKLEDFHVSAGTEMVPQKLLVHDSHPFDGWQHQRNFSNECPGLFCVVGSKSFIEPQTVWNKIESSVPYADWLLQRDS